MKKVIGHLIIFGFDFLAMFVVFNWAYAVGRLDERDETAKIVRGAAA